VEEVQLAVADPAWLQEEKKDYSLRFAPFGMTAEESRENRKIENGNRLEIME